MAVSDIFNSLTFGGINSLDYGIYISGPGVYDAPTRDVEFVSVPGRNGAIEIDKGHWNNIEVTYHAGVFAGNQEDFGKKINAFRNAIVSQVGYQRLTDTYNADEYRLGIYASGIGASTVKTNEAGEFDLIFNCKPQRYLLEGENEITVSSGRTVTNPTLYEASPLMKVYFDPDYISVDGTESITLTSASGKSYVTELTRGPMGPTTLVEDGNFGPDDRDSYGRHACFYPIDIHRLIAPDDYYTIDGLVYESYWQTSTTDSNYMISAVIGKSTGPFSISTRIEDFYSPGKRVYIQVRFDPVSFPQQEDGYEGGETFDLYVDLAIGSPTKAVVRVYPKYSMYVRRLAWTYYNIIDFKYGVHENPQVISGDATYIRDLQGGGSKETIHFDLLSVNLSCPIQGNPTYIDTEIGEAYKIENGEYVDLNQYISLGSDLPKLLPGATTVTCSSHIKDSEVKITPRWWEL